MWQTKYASAVAKNLGVGVDFRPCSKGDFHTGRPWSVLLHNNFRMEFLAWDHCAVALFSARPSSKIPGFAMTHILLSRDIILGQ